jgi:hypothetical protein
MEMVKVRCWPMKSVETGQTVWVTYPDGWGGHDLVMCRACGTVHAADVEEVLYSAQKIDIMLMRTVCYGCGRELGDDWVEYPEHYLDPGGVMRRFVPPGQPPGDDLSVVREFPDVLS